MKLKSDRYQNLTLSAQAGHINRIILLTAVLVLSLVLSIKHIQGQVAADTSKINSGISGYCLDDRGASTGKNAVVDTAKCGSSNAQSWSAAISTITHDGKYCLGVLNSDKNSDSPIVLNQCDGSPGQVWLRDQGGYFNPNSGLCLATSGPESQLKVSSCDILAGGDEVWTPTSMKSSKDEFACTGSEGDKVACSAIKQWTLWQSSGANHENLLNSYTDGTPYEEWCADFVSYIYKQAGYPFSGGESNGWDENNANNILNMGFTQHQAPSGYIPKAGDVAYFNYNGGHVEIVVIGGKQPTFIYGDSATIDPTTGNGQMMANTIMSEADEGQLIYYLSPN